MNKAFEGFSKPESNWSKLPHQLIEAMPLVETLGEFKVIVYILRHTWGYQEFDVSKRITLDEFENGRKKSDGTRLDGGTGLSKPTIIDGLRRAEEHGFIIVEEGGDAGRVKKLYRLNMSNSFTGPVKKLDRSGKESLHRTEKDTCKDTLKDQPADLEGEDLLDAFGLKSRFANEQDNGKTSEAPGPGPSSLWGENSSVVGPRFGVEKRHIQRVGYLLETEYGLAPPWGNKSRMKHWINGCAELYQAADGDMSAIKEAGKKLRTDGLTISRPQSLYNTVASLVAEKRSGEGQYVMEVGT